MPAHKTEHPLGSADRSEAFSCGCKPPRAFSTGCHVVMLSRSTGSFVPLKMRSDASWRQSASGVRSIRESTLPSRHYVVLDGDPLSRPGPPPSSHARWLMSSYDLYPGLGAATVCWGQSDSVAELLHKRYRALGDLDPPSSTPSAARRSVSNPPRCNSASFRAYRASARLCGLHSRSYGCPRRNHG